MRATVEANNLPHVEDVTNDDPTLTTRNAIRRTLRQGKDGENYPTFISSSLAQQVVKDFTSLTRIREEIDQHVDAYISTNRIPSPPSTLALKTALPPEDVDVRHAIILRVLRYVSPQPWGSPKAEAGRREQNLSGIEPIVWPQVISLFRAGVIAKRCIFRGKRWTGRGVQVEGMYTGKRFHLQRKVRRGSVSPPANGRLWAIPSRST